MSTLDINRHRTKTGALKAPNTMTALMSASYNGLTKADQERNDFFYHEVRDRLNHLICCAGGINGSIEKDYVDYGLQSPKWIDVIDDDVSMVKPGDSWNIRGMYYITIMHHATGLEYICAPLAYFGPDNEWTNADVKDVWGIEKIMHTPKDNGTIEIGPIGLIHTHIHWWESNPMIIAAALFAKIDEDIDNYLTILERYPAEVGFDTRMMAEELCQNIIVETICAGDPMIREVVELMMQKGYYTATQVAEALQNIKDNFSGQAHIGRK